ncbi:hypothetical protein OSB04_027324 [Centaurea solstitialis]|uniref:Cytochrome P450 n=1 Tax=Centaurea solstitialis TaxID=347529 RepID=A0AA38SYL2_9ASTR|nr:hypothetical protein OSB04_027324 [Centaurea solstitialis]
MVAWATIAHPMHRPLDVLVGGIDTTFVTMVWAMLEIVRSPRVMQKLQTEIRRHVGRNPEIDASNISKMTYFKMVIKDSIRLHPSAPLLFPRNCSSHCQIGRAAPKNLGALGGKVKICPTVDFLS